MPKGAECAVRIEGLGEVAEGGVDISVENGNVIIDDRALPYADTYTTVSVEARFASGVLTVKARHRTAANDMYVTGNHVRLTVSVPEGERIQRVRVIIIPQFGEKQSFEKIIE